jgi:hypothetical protein
MIFPAFTATSSPTSSISVIGPTGNPNSTSALSMMSIATPWSRSSPASLMYGESILLA